MTQPFIKLENITKKFPGVVALNNVSLDLYQGEIHGLIGENGAGKSTFIKVLTGVHTPEKGEIILKGNPIKIENTKHAIDLEIGCIYQELNNIPQLSVTDNIFLGCQLKKKSGLLDYETMHKKARELLKDLGQDIDPTLPIEKLGMGHQQMVEIVKAITKDIKMLIMDEPTSSLSETEVKELVDAVRKLKNKGVGILFVSHKLEEIFELCDKVTVFRDGQHVITGNVSDFTNDLLIQNMVGREITQQFPKIEFKKGEEILKVENFTRYGVYRKINFSLSRGEILGFSGLVGAGRTELIRGIFGADPIDEGKLYLNGKEVNINSPEAAVRNRFALLTEDRKTQGLVLNASILSNLIITCLCKFKKGLFLDNTKICKAVDHNIKSLQIKTPSPDTLAEQLSGGNQQKVVVGKWLNSDAEIYIFDEPTRGIDVGAKVEVYNLMNKILEENKAIIMISSELPEILGMSDRVIVMRNGNITAEIKRNSKQFTQEDIMHASWDDSAIKE
ncbi:MAG: sugar ABC transporter ATP-binding protein [Spirochaetales bacterium]|nr:sugar ABC transporter ATP-binding protein [Spirochaetales bacterium]